jgi:hypothetical protein
MNAAAIGWVCGYGGRPAGNYSSLMEGTLLLPARGVGEGAYIAGREAGLGGRRSNHLPPAPERRRLRCDCDCDCHCDCEVGAACGGVRAWTRRSGGSRFEEGTGMGEGGCSVASRWEWA